MEFSSFLTFTTHDNGSPLLILGLFTLFVIYNNDKYRDLLQNVIIITFFDIILFILMFQILYNLYQLEISIVYTITLVLNILTGILYYNFYNTSLKEKKGGYLNILYLLATLVAFGLYLYGMRSLF